MSQRERVRGRRKHALVYLLSGGKSHAHKLVHQIAADPGHDTVRNARTELAKTLHYAFMVYRNPVSDDCRTSDSITVQLASATNA